MSRNHSKKTLKKVLQSNTVYLKMFNKNQLIDCTLVDKKCRVSIQGVKKNARHIMKVEQEKCNQLFPPDQVKNIFPTTSKSLAKEFKKAKFWLLQSSDKAKFNEKIQTFKIQKKYLLLNTRAPLKIFTKIKNEVLLQIYDRVIVKSI